ncbi:hypothetical protein HCH54_009134 [Aspergillus fumigatus]
MRFRTSSSHLLTLLPVFLLLQISSLSHVVLPIVRFEQYFLLLSLVSSGILRLHSTIFHSSASFLKEPRLFSPQTQLKNNFPTATVEPSVGVRPGPRS